MKIQFLIRAINAALELEASQQSESVRLELQRLRLAVENISEATLSSLSDVLEGHAVSQGRLIRRPAGKRRELMAKTIKELLATLHENFRDDSAFERAIEKVEGSKLTKADLEVVYQGLFNTEKRFPKAKSRPDIIQAIRSERIARVRYRA